jgi:dynein heavy chain
VPVTDHITRVHQSVRVYSKEFEEVYKRKNYSTPKNYLDFIITYINFLQDRRKALDNAVIRLEGGLATLEQAQASTKIMSEKLAIQNEEISVKKEEVQGIIDVVNQETEVAAEQQAVAKRTEEELAVSTKEINEIAAEADLAVQEAQPALTAAQEALKNVKKAEIQEMGALNAPSLAIKNVCTIVFHYFVKDGKNDDWTEVRNRCLKNTKLTEEMMALDMGTITSA